MPTSKRLRLLVILAITLVSLLLSGCLGGRVVIRPFPKRPVVVRTVAPGPDHLWVEGHWTYDDGSGRYVWVDGRWIVRAPGKTWSPGHYNVVRRGRVSVKVWVPGHWKGSAARAVVHRPQATTTVVVQPAPVVRPAPVVVKAAPVVVMRELPAAPVVRKPTRPAGDVVWVQGHFEWDAGRADYSWVNGRWERRQRGKQWTPGHYRVEERGTLRLRVWVPGHWVAAEGGAAPVAGPVSAARIVVVNPPAAPRVVKPRQPGRDYVWVSGYHVWSPRERQYSWTKGHWMKAQQGRSWVPGHYKVTVVDTHRVKVWIPGHWR